MTCYLTSRDERFAAAVAGGVVSDLVSMGGTSDDAHLLARYELGGEPWAIGDRYQAMSPLSRVESVVTPTLVYHGEADRRCPVGQAQQWHTALRERGVPTTLVLYPDEGHLFILGGRPSHRRDFNRRVTDWVEQHAGARGARGRRGSTTTHWRRRLAVLAERYRVPGAVLGILRVGDGADETCRGLVRAAQQGDRRRGDRRLRLPDRLDDEGLDGNGRHAARRRGEARSRRADRRRAARAGALRSGRHRAGHDAPPPHAHERHRRRRLHGHGPRRRLSRALRRAAGGGCAEPSARGDVVVLQLRLRRSPAG